MAQAKRHSLLEACLNTAIGFTISFIVNMAVMPLVFDIHPTVQQNIVATLIFTVISIARGYYVRRLFNYLHHKEIL